MFYINGKLLHAEKSVYKMLPEFGTVVCIVEMRTMCTVRSEAWQCILWNLWDVCISFSWVFCYYLQAINTVCVYIVNVLLAECVIIPYIQSYIYFDNTVLQCDMNSKQMYDMLWCVFCKCDHHCQSALLSLKCTSSLNIFFQCFDTVGWVIRSVKTRPRYDL